MEADASAARQVTVGMEITKVVVGNWRRRHCDTGQSDRSLPVALHDH